MKHSSGRYALSMAALSAALAAAILLSLTWGRYHIPISRLWDAAASYGGADADETVFWQSRLPRVISAAVIGMALAASGCAYQGVFRNPMISPDLLGATAGAGFGAALGIYFGVAASVLQLASFAFGAVAVALTALARRLVSGRGGGDMTTLVLCGIVITALFQALVSIIKYVADPYDTLPSIAFWLMGGLTYVTLNNLPFLLAPVFIGFIPLMLTRWRVNLLSFGAEEASAMGVNTTRMQLLVIACATLMTSAGVAVGGMIGWVGLIVPHVARMLVGSDQKRLLPCSAVLGGIFLVLVDDAARCLFAQDIPISILTALIGCPLFLYLLYTRKRGFI